MRVISRHFRQISYHLIKNDILCTLLHTIAEIYNISKLDIPYVSLTMTDANLESPEIHSTTIYT